MDMRNIAIIAHVDHGKTTLVDELLKQSGAFRENQAVDERAMDSNDLERERGITIFAKPTSVEWKGTRINIVDTPGHADFGGEVERILSMVDGVVLLVDAAEGPMPQTKFVTSKALPSGCAPSWCSTRSTSPMPNPTVRSTRCLTSSPISTPPRISLISRILYASGRSGWADHDLDGPRKDLTALFDLIVNHVPAPRQIARQNEDPFTMLATTLGSDPFVGRILTGRVESGKLRVGASGSGPVPRRSEDRTVPRDPHSGVPRPGNARISKKRSAGDIVTPSRACPRRPSPTRSVRLAVDKPLEAQPIDPPTITVTFGINDSALWPARDGDKVQARVIRDRLMKRGRGIQRRNQVSPTRPAVTPLRSSGRGELQMGVLIENMRREGIRAFDLASAGSDARRRGWREAWSPSRK